MMHVRRPDWNEDNPAEHGKTHEYRAMLVSIASLRAAVDAAKHAANDSLARLREAPEPHTADNAAFAALYDAHCRDREALFEALRRFEEARADWMSTGKNFGASHRDVSLLDLHRPG